MTRFLFSGAFALVLTASSASAGELSLQLNDAQQNNFLVLPQVMRVCVDAANFGGDMASCKNVNVVLSEFRDVVQQAKAKAEADAKNKTPSDAEAKAKAGKDAAAKK